MDSEYKTLIFGSTHLTSAIFALNYAILLDLSHI